MSLVCYNHCKDNATPHIEGKKKEKNLAGKDVFPRRDEVESRGSTRRSGVGAKTSSETLQQQ